MAYVLLRRVPIANVAPATGFTVFVDQYDTDARRPYRSARQATTNTGSNAPFELAPGALVPGASFCVNSTQRQVNYAGDGKVSTHDVPNALVCASSLNGLVLTTTHSTTLYSNDASISVGWDGGAGPIRVRCALLAPGVAGTEDYYTEQLLPAGTQAAVFAAPVLSTGTPPVEARYRRQQTKVSAAGLAPGQYRVEVLEETGGMLAGELTVFPSHDPKGVNAYEKASTGPDAFEVFGTAPFAVVARYANVNDDPHGGLAGLYSDPLPTGQCFTRYAVRATSESEAVISLSIYDAFTGVVSSADVTVTIPTDVSTVSLVDILPTRTYNLPIGAAAFAVGGITTVYGNGQGGVNTVIGNPTLPRLELANLIYFHPARPTDATGGVLMEVNSFQPAAVTFALLDAARLVLANNTTGRFGQLSAAAYTVRATLGDAVLEMPITLTARYGLKWRLEFADVRVNKPCRLELWARNYTGPVLALEGGAEPVTLETEGFAGGNTQPDLPAVIGGSATLSIRTAPGALADLLVDDRAGRADVYYDDEPVFTGYLQPDIYEEAAVGTTVAVTLTATDGLAALRDVDFAGHVGQELRGRWPVLHTLLHALSRTDLALPVALFTNRRALEMSSDEQPETDLFTDRLGYLSSGKPMDLRAVVDALAQQQGGTLVQRHGRWEVRSALEASADATGRVYDAAGDHPDTETALAPSARLTPERLAKLDEGPASPLYWTKAGQHRQRRAGWRFLTAVGDATYAANAFRQGEYFSDPTAWDNSGTALLPTAGWRPGERAALVASAFPLQLVEAGASSDEQATSWPVASSATDGRYLESELAALAAGREGVAIEIGVSAKFYSGSGDLSDDVFKRIEARLWVEIVGVAASGGIRLRTVGAVLRFPAVRNYGDGFTTATARLYLPILPDTASLRVRVHPFTYYTPVRAREGGSPPVLLLQAVTIQPRPQGATWKAADAYYASGAGGSVRPTGLEVFHVDAPTKAGLFEGVAHAFRRSVTRGLANNPATQWARADDLKPAPLLASAVLDTLALRANPSQVLAGAVHHTRRPPEILDSIDPPYDASGSRFIVGARSWAMKAGDTQLSIVEIGEGEHLVLPTLPPRVRLLHGLTGGRVRVRLTHRGGIRVVHP